MLFFYGAFSVEIFSRLNCNDDPLFTIYPRMGKSLFRECICSEGRIGYLKFTLFRKTSALYAVEHNEMVLFPMENGR